MGSVYEAVHDTIERHVALKLLNPEHIRNTELLTRFFNEARAVNRVNHPGLVQIFDHGQLPDGTAYIVMELLTGETLGQRVRRLHRRLRLQDTLRLLQQVTSTLAATHAKGIVHRDLKPDNIMIVADAAVVGGERTKVLDFGIAKLHPTGQQKAASTRADLLMGTPGYMSPEQCTGAGGVDDKTDVYALGVMMFRLLAGRMPFVATGSGALMAKHIYEPPPSLTEFAPWLPPSIVSLVGRLLVKDKDQRPTMATLSEELQQLQATLADFELPLQALVEDPSTPSLQDDGIQERSELDEGASADSDSVMPTVNVDIAAVSAAAAAAGGIPHPSSESSGFVSQPSTLNTSTGERAALAVPVAKTSRKQLVAVLSGAVLLGALLAVSLQQLRGTGKPTTRQGSGAVGSAQVPTTPTPKKHVRWSLNTQPAGAEIIRVSTGQVLGQTPWQAELPTDQGTEELRLQLPGYQQQLLRLDRSADVQLSYALKAAPPEDNSKGTSVKTRPGEPGSPAEPQTGEKPTTSTKAPKDPGKHRKKGGNVQIEFEE